MIYFDGVVSFNVPGREITSTSRTEKNFFEVLCLIKNGKSEANNCPVFFPEMSLSKFVKIYKKIILKLKFDNYFENCMI